MLVTDTHKNIYSLWKVNIATNLVFIFRFITTDIQTSKTQL